MTKQYELCCRDLQGNCDFAARAKNVDALLTTVARHATESHGMRSFPASWYGQMRHVIRTASDGYVELACREMTVDCDVTTRGETLDQLKERYAMHAKERHGMVVIPAELWPMLERQVRTIDT